MTRQEGIKTLVDEVCDSTEDATQLAQALTVGGRPMGYPLEAQVEALGTVGYWVEVAGDHRRQAKMAEKLKWQMIEGVLERAAHTLDKSIVATMHNNNMAERQYHNSGR